MHVLAWKVVCVGFECGRMDGNGHMMTMMMIVAMTTMVVVMMIVSALNVESTIVDGWMALDTINSVHKLLRGPDRLAFYFSVDFYKSEQVLLQSTAM